MSEIGTTNSPPDFIDDNQENTGRGNCEWELDSKKGIMQK